MWARALGVTIVGLVVTILTTQRSRFELPFCATCNVARKRRDLLGWLSWAPGVGLMILGPTVIAMGNTRGGGILILVGLVVFFVLSTVAALIGTAGEIRLVKIADGHTWLVGASAAALAASASAKELGA